jgi:hypothetical protein
MEPGAGMGPQPMPMEAPPPKRHTSGGIIAIIGAILLLIGIFLPWISFNYSSAFTSVSLNWPGILTIWGIIALVMAILVLVMAAVKKPLLAGVFGLIAFILVLVPLLLSVGIAASYGATLGMFEIIGIGWYLSIVGSLIAMIGGFVGHKQM